jgi:hypoxanthine phosphoribosyltransferase
MIEKTWNDFFYRLDEIKFEQFDLIVAIARGGIIPASFIQQKLNTPMKIIEINYRDDSHKPRYDEPQLLENLDFKVKDKKILLVDDVSKTGKTIQKAKEQLKGNSIKTCIVNGNADYSFFQHDTCIKMPWKR